MLERLKEGYKARSIGYYFTAAVTLLALVLAIMYFIAFSKTEYFSGIALIALVVIFLGNGILFLTGKNEWSPLVSVVLSVLAFCFFILGIYHYVSIVLVGIDLQTFSNDFIINTILFVLLFVLSSSSLFLKQSK